MLQGCRAYILKVGKVFWINLKLYIILSLFAGFTVQRGVQGDITLHKCESFDSALFQENEWTVPNSLRADSFADYRFKLEKVKTPLKCDSLRENIDVDILPEIAEISPIVEEEIVNFQDANGTELVNVTYPISEPDYDVPKPVVHFTPTGFLIVNGKYFRLDEYCVQRISEDEVTVKTCEINCSSETTPCIPICCSMGKVIHHNGSHERCRPSGSKQYSPTFYKDLYTQLSPEEAMLMRPHFVRKSPNCGGAELMSLPFRSIHNIPKSIVRVLKNGKVKYLVSRERVWKEMDEDQYCLSGLSGSPEGLDYSGDEEDQILYTCKEYTDSEVVAPEFYIPVYFVGSFFLFTTAVVYIMLWEKQNVHGWTVLSFVLSMFFMFTFLASSHLLSLFDHNNHEWVFTENYLCPFIGMLAHFFLLSTFCWLSVINFDLWLMFKSMAPVSGRSKGKKRFIYYVILAWGLPAIIVSVGITLQLMFPDPESEVIVPGYGNISCFLVYTAKGVYFYYDIGVLMAGNLIFMCLTLYTICKFKASTRAVEASRSNNSQTLSLRLFFKLFVVMGVTWIFEVISWWQSIESTFWYWVILDIFNLLQSIGIFLIFVCKRKILNQLEQKYPSLKVITGPLKNLTVSRRCTRTVTTTTTGGERNTSRMTAFSIKRFQTSLSSKL